MSRTKGTHIDLTGEFYRDLEVIQFIERRGNSTVWLTRCVCGNERQVTSRALRSGDIKRCKECAARANKPQRDRMKRHIHLLTS